MKSKKNIFLTGGSGFIGNKIVQELANDCTLYILTRRSVNSTNNTLKYIQGDLLNLNEHDDLFKIIDVIIHVAGEKKDESKMFEMNVLGSRKIAAIVKHNKHIKLIHISSGGVFGIYNHNENSIVENSNCYPNNQYEKTKLLAEKEIETITDANKFIILRPTNVFGENDTSNKLLHLIKLINANRFLFLNRNAMVNYVYVGQLSYIISKIIALDKYQNDIFIVNAACSIAKLNHLIQLQSNIKFEFKALPLILSKPLKILALAFDYLPTKFQKINSGKINEMTSENYYNSKKINEYLGGLDEEKFLEEGLKKLINYYKNKQLL